MDPGWRSGKRVDFGVAVEAGSVWISTTLRLMLINGRVCCELNPISSALGVTGETVAVQIPTYAEES
jgi:hypothetical protein